MSITSRPLRGLLLGFVLLVSGAGCAGERATDAAATDRPHVEAFRYQNLPDGSYVVAGELVNPTARSIRNAQVRVALYDDANRRVATISLEVKDVEAGTRKAFREYIDGRGVRGARVRSVLVL